MHPVPLISGRQLLLKAFRMLPEDVSWDEILETTRFVVAIKRQSKKRIEVNQYRLKSLSVG
jgi:hypothetical protein